MLVPETVISEILNSVNIVDFISQYINLKKAGRNFVGLCPFHSEKTPSFSVSPEKNMFYCFGCGEGGNIFSFLMKYENLTFPEAARSIAEQYNIKIPENYSSAANSKTKSLKESILSLNKKAAKYYNYLLNNSPVGNKGSEYLKKRKIPKDIVDTFMLGMAPEGWDNLYAFLCKEGVSSEIQEKAGLVIKKKSGTSFYDRFRERLVFPIFDIRGNIIGFGGRIIGDGIPKYLNSPETPVYNKSSSLYGLYQAREHCRKENLIYIVEGYLDVLALYKSGIKNCAATLGTSLTSMHVKTLKGYAEKMVLVYDGDEAGIKAAARSIEIFANEGADVSVFILPDRMDPDDFINSFGADKFREESLNAQEAVDFITKYYLKLYGNTIEGKVKVVTALESLMNNINDAVTKNLYVKRISQILNIEERALQERFGQNGSSIDNKNSLSANLKINSEYFKIEISLLAALSDVPELKKIFIDKKIADKIENESVRKSVVKILESDNNSDSVLTVDSGIEPMFAKIRIEQGSWNLKSAKILVMQFENAYRKKKAGLHVLSY
ncbi:MAG: DNA primase [Desulfobacteraceae bacterium]|nr:DNA primase [Desulfobacteraceae bacterium]